MKMKVTNKESTSDGSERKRKKLSELTKFTKEDVYQNVVNFEEAESKSRSVEKDSTLFHQTCDDLRKIFDSVTVLKKKTSEQAKQDITDKRIDGSLLFVLLKKLNRLDKVRFKDCREALQKEKLRVDSNRLQLQNLLYEADHLNKEIQRCYQFKSQDEEINLVTVEEFYEEAPEAISRPAKTKSDEHAKRLARLEWELQQRKELSKLYSELLKEKDKVSQEINKKAERIDSLAPRLDSLLKATRPLQDALELHIEKDWEIQKCSKFLPRPLYLLYANLSAYISATEDKHLSVAIGGDEEEAKQIEDCQDTPDSDVTINDSDGEDVELEDEGQSKGHHRRLSKSAVLEQKISKLYKSHPLTVTLLIANKKKKGNSFNVTFTYLPTLGFVTVQCNFIGQNSTGTSGDILRTVTILNSLFGSDNGEISPNPKTKYQLCTLGIDYTSFNTTLEEKDFGKPYIWAQKLCGLDFINTSGIGDLKTDLSVKTLPEAVKALRQRWESRMTIQQQIRLFEENNVDFVSSLNISSSVRLSSNLVQCTAISWPEYLNHNKSKKFIDENNVNENDLLYRVVLTRGSAKLECYISIPCNFPTAVVLWSLHLNWNGNHNAENNSSIREMEFWINNTIKDVKSSSQILVKQIERALCCLDIYTETEGIFVKPVEFTPEKTFLKSVRGRQRSRPYKVIDNEGCAVFTQIKFN